LYAKWGAAPFPSGSVREALNWLYFHAQEGGNYIITLNADEFISTNDLYQIGLYYNGKKVNISISGDSWERTVNFTSNLPVFTVPDGVTLTLGSNLALRGKSDNYYPMIKVNAGGTVINNGSKISGHISRGDYASAVDVEGTFIMNGGEISGNTFGSGSDLGTPGGGGVSVYNGTFTMNNGKISGNSATYGGGVFVEGGTFTMNGGEISGNNVIYGFGGGVYVKSGGTFTLKAGTISGNTAGNNGGGVFVAGSDSTFTKQSGGIIYGADAGDTLSNTAGFQGHAAYVNSSPVKKRNTTAGSAVTLDSRLDGAAGGWVDPSYTVTFDADGGSGGTTRTVEYDTSAGSLPTPEKTGYIFGGWYTAQNGGGTQFTASTRVSGSITVYAKWTMIQYTVNFNINGGSGTAPPARTVNYGGSITLPGGIGLSKTGHSFGGWNSRADGLYLTHKFSPFRKTMIL
jgi:uncharacterized repeat protein (TIGR02543 family)